MKITAAERLFYLKLEADAAFDVSVNREAKAIFGLFFKHLRAARLNKSFFKKDRITDKEFGIDYRNTYFDPIKYPKISDMHVISCSASQFSKIERVDDLRIIFAIHDDLSFRRGGAFYGRNSVYGKVIVLYDYLEPTVYDENTEFPYEGFRTLLKEMAVPGHKSRMESTFVHEYVHFVDSLRAEEKSDFGNQSKIVQPESNYAAYINDPLEVNARYAEWVVNVVESFSRLLAVKRGGVGERFPDFKSFWTFYWTHPGYVPVELRLYAHQKTQQRLARRFYKFWEWSVAQQKSKSLINEKSAMNFVKKQIMREFKGNKSDPDRFYSPSTY